MFRDLPIRKVTRRLAAGVAILAVGAYYLWQLRANGDRLDFVHDQGGYYNYLGRALASGHLELPIKPSPQLLALPNPWDPAVDEALKMHDMALFQGRYYLYHGPGPAVLLFTPWRLITGHDLPERFALFLLCFGGFFFSCGVLREWLRLAGVKAATPLLVPMLLALGLCQSVPYLLNRVWVYEIAIAGGYFCISAALFFLTRGMGTKRCRGWLAASGAMFGMAIACRPHLGLCGVLVLAAMLWRKRGVRSREAMAFAAAFALVAAGVAAYNFARFGNPLEFGVRYLLAGPDQNRVRPALANLLPGLYYWLLCPPDVSAVFPWVRLAFRYPFGSADWLPRGYFMEATAGALFLAPFLPAAAFVPAGPEIRSLARTVLACTAAAVLFLASIGFTTQRYEVDFLPMAILAALGNLAIHIHRATGVKRGVLSGAIVAAIGCGVVVNLALGIAGPYDLMRKERPRNYARLASWFSPVERFRPLLNPDVRVTFTAEFRTQPDGFREPLVVMGGQAYRYFLFVEHAGGGLRFVSMADRTPVVWETGMGRAAVEVTFAAGRLRATVNGQEIAVHEVGSLVLAPAEIAIGENRVEPGLTDARFRGKITGAVVVCR